MASFDRFENIAAKKCFPDFFVRASSLNWAQSIWLRRANLAARYQCKSSTLSTFSEKIRARTKLSLVYANTISSGSHGSAWLPELTKKIICHWSDAPQKGLRHWFYIQYSTRRIQTFQVYFCWGHAFTCFKNQEVKQWSQKNRPERSEFSLSRAFQRWSRNCRNSFGSFANYFFVCALLIGNPAVSVDMYRFHHKCR